MKNFCLDLREHATKIIDYDKKEMIPLTNEEKKNIVSKKFVTYDDDDNKNYREARDHCHFTGKYRDATHNICNLRYKTPKEIPVVFHNGSTYDYHFIILLRANRIILRTICMFRIHWYFFSTN